MAPPYKEEIMEKYFTTSKGVHVGRLYVNRTVGRPIVDHDMQLLQRALTAKHKSIKQRLKDIALYVSIVGGLVAIISLAVMYRPDWQQTESSYKKDGDVELRLSTSLGDQ